MANHIEFKPFEPSDRDACLQIFDENCPLYFATNEREDYSGFLNSFPEGYEVCMVNSHIVGAYGLAVDDQKNCHLNWILISPDTQGSGIGNEFMTRAIARAKCLGSEEIQIAASHLSAPFFAKYGALEVNYISDGWGLGMHRVDMRLKLP
ncbi:GNAT family N-acetyltransferase [Vibrio kagoshimensis]|uniref:GNAT family N-acetyltransferase n=1 Tax=Vibrio kagoshimensis TaxID=2910244 RepID=UPI003D23109A